MGIEIFCDICNKKINKDFITLGSGDYCSKCMKNIKKYIKELKNQYPKK